jgi:NAD(P)-dependent dehydrogenase (short-subunit alcohol dehydrogenase family)
LVIDESSYFNPRHGSPFHSKNVSTLFGVPWKAADIQPQPLARVAPRRFRVGGTSQRVGGYVGFSGNRPAALPHMKPGSAIITTSSVNAYNPDKTIIDYAATKGAIMIFTKGLAKQLAQKGIRVNSVAPGPIWTSL